MMPSFLARLFCCLLAWVFVAGNLHAAPQGACVDALESLAIQETGFNFFRGGSGFWVSTIGKVKNTSAKAVEGINLEVQYFDAEKKLINVSNQFLYGQAILPEGSLAFRIDTDALRAKSDYASQEVRVTSACTQKQGQSSFWDIPKNWWPILLLIVVWITLYLFSARKTSPTARFLATSVEHSETTNALLKEQKETTTALIKEQNQTLERIANALEKTARLKEERQG